MTAAESKRKNRREFLSVDDKAWQTRNVKNDLMCRKHAETGKVIEGKKNANVVVQRMRYEGGGEKNRKTTEATKTVMGG